MKNNHQKLLLSKNCLKVFGIYKKNGIHVKEPCQVYMCTKFHVDVMKNDRVLVFLEFEEAIFHPVLAVSAFSRFSKFVRFGPFKKCSRVIFRVLDEKLTQKHVSHHPNPKFSVWPFLDLVTLNDLDLEYAQRKLRMILRSVPDTIFVVLLTYFHFIRLSTNPDTRNRQTFWLWPDLWRHQWPPGQQH